MEVTNNKQLEHIFVIKERIAILQEELDRCKEDLLDEMNKNMVYEVTCEYGKAAPMSFDRGTLNQEKVEKALQMAQTGMNVPIDNCKNIVPVSFLMCRQYEDAVIPLEDVIDNE